MNGGDLERGAAILPRDSLAARVGARAGANPTERTRLRSDVNARDRRVLLRHPDLDDVNDLSMLRRDYNPPPPALPALTALEDDTRRTNPTAAAVRIIRQPPSRRGRGDRDGSITVAGANPAGNPVVVTSPIMRRATLSRSPSPPTWNGGGAGPGSWVGPRSL